MSIDKKATIQLNLSWIMAAFIVFQSFGMLNITTYIDSLKLIPKISERLDKQDEEIKRIKDILVRANLAHADLKEKQITTAQYD